MGVEVGRASTTDVQMLQQGSMGIERNAQNGQVNTTDNQTNQQQHQELKSNIKEEMQKAIKSLNKLITPHHTNLHFAFHEKLNRYYVQIVDSTTHEVIKEIPPRKFLDAHAATLELLGFLVDKKV